ncbi:ASPIC/UnbV domain protein [Emticicia oligotrophica DSM 17448]|uniref:ASPIC/UnbV domain protein n=1 Tax=Emticicia oligotrophica (strain DSM 17448 / CIP 109782 / MTCC 6937 / GPTSA100-15) TaxID=929562 RepID=A0ABM5N183_EMTOG|nr:VCBS repeat-containing protein [Emticicia oligotrophica]AFK03182.1 ASPIC/UnbV domain protein [Emticicia oligotrophica DSM 17448]
MIRRYFFLSIVSFSTIAVLGIISCSSKNTKFEKLSAQKTGIDFINKVEENDTQNVLNYEYFYNGGGVAAADFNNDGLLDLYFTANLSSDKLYINKGDKSIKFEDITEKAGITYNGEWKTGVSVVDINNDGWNDIYVSVSGNIDNPSLRKNKLYINNKNLTFTDKAAEYGLDSDGYTTQTAFFDYDKDGDLDAYVMNHNVKDFNRFDVQAIHAMRDSLAGDKLLKNDNGKFVDVSVEAGIKGNPIGFGLGLHIADLNNDNWPDIYVSNDYIESDYLYINNKNGTFSDNIALMTDHTSYFSMGNDIADFNNDLLPDIITLDMLPEDNKRQKLLFGPDNYEAYLSMLKNGFHPETMRNMLHLNNGDGTFSEIGQVAGISNTDWSWAALFADYDNDGYKDLFVTNGYLRDYTNMDFMKYYADKKNSGEVTLLEIIKQMPATLNSNYIFKNNGDLTFSNLTKEWGIELPINSNGAIYADLDNDGDLELIVNNVNAEASIYKNLQQENEPQNYVELSLKNANKSLEGTKIYAYSGGLKQYQEVSSLHGFQSSIAAPLHFGLGKNQQIDSLRIVWNDNTTQVIRNLAANKNHTISYQRGIEYQPFENDNPFFVQVSDQAFSHAQMPLNDFARQVLLPQMYSYQGPALAVGDINGDKLEDVYLGGGKGSQGKIIIQDKMGNFRETNQMVFKQDELCTDADAAFFDADNDGDLDLYVVSGGYEYLVDDFLLQDRLYLNDGRGNFSKSEDRLPVFRNSKSKVVPFDADNDGDLDLFLSGYVVPQNYPAFNPSALLINDKGVFKESQNEIFTKLGLITDAAAVDVNKDGQKDLVFVGEWMPVTILKNQKGQFTKQEIPGTNGFWQSIEAADLDNDGDQDIVVGNMGQNTQYKASLNEPFTLTVKDFDGNGKIDPILSYYIQGKSHPAYSLDELATQVPNLRKQYTNYQSYSEAQTTDVLKFLGDNDSFTNKIFELSSGIIINQGENFIFNKLPIAAQFSMVNTISIKDLNGDKLPDLLLAGNNTKMRARIGNIDANHGQVFINKGGANFEYIPQHKSGLNLRGDVKNMAWAGNKLLFGLNNAPMKIYQKNL